jgi:hypothetical protein
MHPSQSPNLVRPNNVALAETAGRVLSEWAYLASQPAGQPAPGPAPLPLEYSVRLSGPAEFQLVMRSTEALGATVAVASTGDPSASGLGPDAFRELVNLVAGHLLTDCLEGGTELYRAFLPETSGPADWPQGDPMGQALLMVENQPIEIRLWASHAKVRAGLGRPGATHA